MKRINDSAKTKFRSAEKFKTCTIFKSKSFNWISKFADQIFHKQSRKRFNKILCHTRTLDSVFYSIQLHNFFSPKILMTYFLHGTKLFVLHTTSPELYIKFCTCQRHKTVNEFRWFGIIEHKVNHNKKKKGWYVAKVMVFNTLTRLVSIVSWHMTPAATTFINRRIESKHKCYMELVLITWVYVSF